jgi:hypothetical protein
VYKCNKSNHPIQNPLIFTPTRDIIKYEKIAGLYVGLLRREKMETRIIHAENMEFMDAYSKCS